MSFKINICIIGAEYVELQALFIVLLAIAVKISSDDVLTLLLQFKMTVENRQFPLLEYNVHTIILCLRYMNY